MKKTRMYRWYIAAVSGSSFVNRRIFEQTGYDEHKFHPETKCFDKNGLEIIRDLYGFADRREFLKAKKIAGDLKASVELFVQENSGKIRQMPERTRVKPWQRQHLFARRCAIH